jgi:hypothetical protein
MHGRVIQPEKTDGASAPMVMRRALECTPPNIKELDYRGLPAIVLILGRERACQLVGCVPDISGFVTRRGIAKYHLLREIGEAVGHGRGTRLVVLSQPPPDLCSDLRVHSSFSNIVLHDNPQLRASEED